MFNLSPSYSARKSSNYKLSINHKISPDKNVHKKKKKKTKKKNKNKKHFYKCIVANTNVIWQHAAHTTTNSLHLTAKQDPYKKAYILTKNIKEFSGKSLEERATR